MPRTTLVLSISADPEVAQRLDQNAQREGLSRSEFLIRAGLRRCDEIEAKSKPLKRKPNATELISGHASSGADQLAALQSVATRYQEEKL